MAQEELRYLVDQYIHLNQRLLTLEESLEELVIHVPGASEMVAIKGVSSMTVVAFFAEVGDLSNLSRIHAKSLN